MKTCPQCKIEKELSEFYKTEREKDGLYWECKECNVIRKRNRRKLHPWTKNFEALKKRCNNKKHDSYPRYGGSGIKALITLNEIKQLWFRDKAYLLDKPSIDRIDNDGNYEYGNCRFIELSENSKLSNIKHARKILQFDLNKIFIHEWLNAKEIEKNTSFLASTIRANCRGKIKTAYKYIWEYKKGVK